MKPRIHVITLAVEDLERALAFYRDGLGLATAGVIGTEFPGDATSPAGAELAKDASVPLGPPRTGEFSIGHAVASREDVDVLLRQAEAAGATLTDQPHDRAWGIYSGYFRDPDGHLWEIMWNPEIDVDS